MGYHTGQSENMAVQFFKLRDVRCSVTSVELCVFRVGVYESVANIAHHDYRVFDALPHVRVELAVNMVMIVIVAMGVVMVIVSVVVPVSMVIMCVIMVVPVSGMTDPHGDGGSGVSKFTAMGPGEDDLGGSFRHATDVDVISVVDELNDAPGSTRCECHDEVVHGGIGKIAVPSVR